MGEKKKYNAAQYGRWVYLGKGKCMYFTFMQQEEYSNKICKYKSLHEINFIHKEHLDSVFIQQHMHTYILPFPLAHSWCFQLLFDPLSTCVRVKESITKKG